MAAFNNHSLGKDFLKKHPAYIFSRTCSIKGYLLKGRSLVRVLIVSCLGWNATQWVWIICSFASYFTCMNQKHNLLVIAHALRFAKIQQMHAPSFIALLQMTPKNMLKYFQTLKGWISFRIITSDATRLVYCLRFSVYIHTCACTVASRKCLKRDGTGCLTNKLVILHYKHNSLFLNNSNPCCFNCVLIIYSHSTLNHQFLIKNTRQN